LASPVVRKMVSTTRMVCVYMDDLDARHTLTSKSVDNNSLYTQPEDIYEIYAALSSVSPYFSIAAGFGNVHGVYKPGNVKLRPELLQSHQKYVKEKASTKGDKPVYLVCTYIPQTKQREKKTDFVFQLLVHGGSGSSVEDFREAM
jgi:fructose-bisphosphate aldolase class II